MIKFFRKIRQNLLLEGKTGKYLKYAIGEIILVVLGIMIALEFNNRNEQNRNLSLVVETIDALEEELLDNFDEASFVLNFWSSQDVICKQVLFDQLTIEDYRNNDLIGIVAANWYDYNPKTENLHLLLEYEKLATKRLKPIINAAKELENRENLLLQQWNVLRANIAENIETITKEVSLVKMDSISKNKQYNHMLTDSNYKKIVELYWISAQVYYDFISRHRAQAIAILSTIKIIQEDYNREKLETLYKSKGMNPFTALDCNPIQLITNNNEIRRAYLIGNISEEDITLRIVNDGKAGDTYTLKPNQLRYTRPEFAGLDGDYTVVVEQLDSNSNCIQKYVAVNKGYLLIE